MAWRSGGASQRHSARKGRIDQSVGLTNICQLARTTARSGASSPRARPARRTASSLRWPSRLARPRASMAAEGPGRLLSSCASSCCERMAASSGRRSTMAAGRRNRKSASARCSTSSATASSTPRIALSAEAWRGWPRSDSRSSSLASRWSRISSTVISMPARRWRRSVRGDSSTRSRVDCSWSASAACSRSSWPSSGAAISRTSSDSSGARNWRACVRISADTDSSRSAIICTR